MPVIHPKKCWIIFNPTLYNLPNGLNLTKRPAFLLSWTVYEVWFDNMSDDNTLKHTFFIGGRPLGAVGRIRRTVLKETDKNNQIHHLRV